MYVVDCRLLVTLVICVDVPLPVPRSDVVPVVVASLAASTIPLPFIPRTFGRLPDGWDCLHVAPLPRIQYLYHHITFYTLAENLLRLLHYFTQLVTVYSWILQYIRVDVTLLRYLIWLVTILPALLPVGYVPFILLHLFVFIYDFVVRYSCGWFA